MGIMPKSGMGGSPMVELQWHGRLARGHGTP
jgi:hypothetical protein